MTEYKKCSVENNILMPCPSLETAMEYEGRRKGITLLEIYNFKENRTSKTMAVLRSGYLPKNGVVINFCPFCGESIAHHLKMVDE